MKLVSYHASTAAYRVRIALNLKKVDYEIVPLSLLDEGGQQLKPEFVAENPQKLVPVLRIGDASLSQSMAILEYLEEQFPDPPLLPSSPVERALARSFALHIACDVHPLNNLRVRRYLSDELAIGEEAGLAWYHHWIGLAFEALETQAAEAGGPFCLGDKVTLADVCLVPQMFNARRFKLDLSPYPNLVRADAAALALEAFADAAPSKQPDFPKKSA